MAATQTPRGLKVMWPFHVSVVDVSTLEPGATVNVAHGGPTGAEVLMVTHEVTTRPTSRDVVEVSHLRASDSTTNDTAAVAIDTTDVGDLTGAVVRLYFWFVEAASGGNRAANA